MLRDFEINEKTLIGSNKLESDIFISYSNAWKSEDMCIILPILKNGNKKTNKN